ncbi:MAG TPA: hypothetical protein VGN97_04705 [Mesorhizobium sp.]|nr:hypothetical protein [Mesorhizobium sp.]
MATRRRTRRKAAAVPKAVGLMLAPAVVAMRMPLLAAEAASHGVARPETLMAVSEKAEAFAEGVVAAQMSLARSAWEFWPSVFAGRSPASLGLKAGQAALDAALGPAHKAVGANFRRLSRPKV